MKKLDFGQVVTLLANLGVIAGIVFLGIEMQQNNALMEAEARRNRADFGAQAALAIATDGELAALVFKDHQGEPLSGSDAFRVSRLWFAAITNLEAAYYELPPADLANQAGRWRSFFENYAVLRQTWAEESGAFSADFVIWVNENLREDSD